MSIIGSTDLADGMQCALVNHDPTSVATDLLKGSLIIDANGKVYRKMDDGPTTNVCDVGEHKNNDTATVAPTIDDDVTLDYSVGSFWFDVTADKGYVCLDALDGAAVWWEITGAGSGDTLPIVDTTPVVKGSGDATKLVRIEADGLTSGQTRVLSMPDANITPDDASAARTPTAHKDSHKSGGGDELTASDLLETPIKRIRTTDGPTDMVVGAVADGEMLQRSGATIVGASAAGLPVVDTTPVVKGSGDDTKLVRIEADGLTSGATRVLSMPDADITPDDASATRTPSTHASSHENAGGDEIGVAGLSGALADPQTPTAHDLGGSEHGADTLANLNAKVTGATLDDSSASRTPTSHAASHQNGGGDEVGVGGLSGLLADGQTPLAHKDTHKSGGGDAFTAADLLEAAVKRVQTSTGPTILTVGAIAEAEALVRIGSTLVGSPRVAENLYLKVRNETGAAIAKGKLLYVLGYSGAHTRVLVGLADKDDSAKRPAVAITTEIIADDGNSDVALSVGSLSGFDTSGPGWSLTDQLVLGNTGDMSRPPPDVDPFTGEIQLIGSVTRVHATLGSVFVSLSSGLLPVTAAEFFATKEITPTGSVSGGEVTRATGLNVDIAAGSGFVNDGTDVFRVSWNAVTDLALTASDTNYIFVDKNGVVQDSVSAPSPQTNILLADAITNGSSILMLSNHQTILAEHPAQFHDYAKDVIGNVVVSGIITAKDAIAYRLEVSAGTYYNHDFKSIVPATDPITFMYWYRDGGGGWTKVPSTTLIDEDNWDNGTGTLNSLVSGEWKKDLLVVVYTASGLVEYHVFYGQEVFATQGQAEAGALPAADSDLIANGVRSGGIVIEGAAAAIASVVDERPFLGQLSPGTTAVTDHGLLTGLGDDDHAQYLPTSGARAMSGDLDMGAQAVINVGNVDGVDVSGHASRHENAGADEMSVAGLSGTLADAQTPTVHKDSHKSGGGDAFAAADLLEAIVKRLQTTDGPTTLLMGAVADGEYLRRSGTAVIGGTPGGGGGESYVDRGDPSAADYTIGAGLTADGTWRTLDLSSIVPAAAASKLVHLRCRIIDNTVEAMMQIRTLGKVNAINAARGVIANGNDSFWFDAWVVVDSLRRVEYNIDSGMSTAEITVAGWKE